MNTVCFYLNVIRLSLVAALIRKAAALLLPTRYGAYAQPTAGYAGWLDSRAGVVAFIREDGSLQWVW